MTAGLAREGLFGFVGTGAIRKHDAWLLAARGGSLALQGRRAFGDYGWWVDGRWWIGRLAD